MSVVALGLTDIAPLFLNPVYLYCPPTTGLVITPKVPEEVPYWVLPALVMVIVPVSAVLTVICIPSHKPKLTAPESVIYLAVVLSSLSKKQKAPVGSFL